jgi:hypothetical protein
MIQAPAAGADLHSGQPSRSDLRATTSPAVGRRAGTAGSMDADIKERLQMLSSASPNFWDFRYNRRSLEGTPYFQYPAMMIPRMQGAILDCFAEAGVGASILDAYAGSGTILHEAMKRGLDFHGVDVNPLAVLLCQVKSGPFWFNHVEKQSESLLTQIRSATARDYAINFANQGKWFSRRTMLRLSRIHRAIRGVGSKEVRRFYWLALAETVRLTSNSRTSTFKLHTRPKADLRKDKRDALGTFESVLARNLLILEDHQKQLTDCRAPQKLDQFL